MATDSTPPAGLTPGSLDWFSLWRRMLPTAPETLVQPVLPGWTFNINANNSAAPQTEVDVLAKVSYGRQLGRISDVLELLISERPKAAKTSEAVADFLAIKKEIDDIKQQAAAGRIAGLVKDLEVLKLHDRKAYDRLRTALLKNLS